VCPAKEEDAERGRVEGRREKGEGRREKGEGRRETGRLGDWETTVG
jgi:hypothetical protein